VAKKRKRKKKRGRPKVYHDGMTAQQRWRMRNIDYYRKYRREYMRKWRARRRDDD
jgi:hypothetical protein